MAASFVPDPRRQATAAIRGYVYQVDRTLECWLLLALPSELHLECGEDIDEVKPRFGLAEERCLEQVKHEESSLTLRNPNALSAIANFIVTRKNNPNLELQFRYLTNAPMVKERIADVKESGVALWHLIRAGGMNEEKANQALSDIRYLLRGASRPAKYNEENWKEFVNFWKSDQKKEQLELICGLEWVEQAPAASRMDDILQRKLLELGYAQDQTQAQELYSRLFTRVMKLLATPGPKILTCELRRESLETPLSSEEKQAHLQILLAISEMRSDILDLKDRAAKQEKRQTDLSQLLMGHLLSGLPEQPSNLDFTPSAPTLEVPCLVEHLTERSATVGQLLPTLKSCSWLALEGTISCGKTHLGALLARHFPTKWLSLRDSTGTQALQRMDAACFSIAGLDSKPNLDDFFARSGPQSLWVLDDLPAIAGYDALAERLVAWAQSAAKHQVFLLSTSHYPLPLEIEERLGTQLTRLPVPALTTEETGELLQAHGAPNSILNSAWLLLIHQKTKGHPALLVAFARHVKATLHNWDENAVNALFDSEFAEDLNEQTTKRLLRSLQNDERELLYRLNTRQTEFTREVASILAQVAPPVSHPDEKLSSLTGLWVQRAPERRFWVSPLVQSLGEGNLAPTTRRDCHEALARFVLKKGRLEPVDLGQVILHFSQAENWEAAGGFLIHALHQLWEMEFSSRPTNEAGLTYFWWDMEIPKSMSLELRLVLRSYQIAFAGQWNESGVWMGQNLLELLKNASPSDGAGLVSPLVLAAEPIARFDFALHCQIVGEVLSRVILPLRLRGEAALEIPEGQSLYSFVWFSTRHIQNTDDLFAWLGILEKMPTAGRKQAESDAVAADGCLEVSARLWCLELEKPEDESQFETLAQDLTLAAQRALALEMPLLGAAFTRIAVTIHGETLKNTGAARLAAETSLAQIEVDEAAFLIEDALGRALALENQNEAAAHWLNRAVNRDASRFPQQKMQALVCYAKAVADWKNDFPTSIEACSRAVDVASALPQSEQARALGELALAAWKNKDWLLCAESLEKAVLRLMTLEGESIQPADEDWKQAFVLLGHVFGWMVSEASRSRPPLTEDGQEYATPFQTMLLGSHSAVTRLYGREKEIILWVQLASLWSAVGQDEKARQWALVGWKILKRENNAQSSLAASVLLSQLIPYWIENNDFAQALTMARQQGLAFVRSTTAQEQGIAFRSLLSVEPVENIVLDEFAQKRIEEWISNTFLLPSAFRLAQISLLNPKEAARKARDVAALCRQHGQQSPVPDYWQQVADLLEASHNDAVSPQQMLARKIESNSNHFYNTFLIISYLGASLKPTLALSDALQLHLACLPTLDTGFLASNRISYRRFVARFCFDFWNTAFALEHSAFNDKQVRRMGGSLEQGLLQATRMPPEQGLKQLLMVLSIGLNFKGSEEAQKWLLSN